MSLYERPCHGGPCTLKGMEVPGFCQCKADAERIAKLEKELRIILKLASRMGFRDVEARLSDALKGQGRDG